MMKRRNVDLMVALGAVVCAACNGDGLEANPKGLPDEALAADMTVIGGVDSALPPDVDDAGIDPYNACGDVDPLCEVFELGPEYDKPFPLPTDAMHDPAVAADGVRRDANGWLVLGQPQGSMGGYSYIVNSGCWSGTAHWFNASWVAEVPRNTTLTLHARSGPTAAPDKSWGTWTADYKIAPVDLSQPDVLVPNWPAQDNATYLQVELTFGSSDPAATPKLRSLRVVYKCWVPL